MRIRRFLSTARNNRGRWITTTLHADLSGAHAVHFCCLLCLPLRKLSHVSVFGRIILFSLYRACVFRGLKRFGVCCSKRNGIWTASSSSSSSSHLINSVEPQSANSRLGNLWGIVDGTCGRRADVVAGRRPPPARGPIPLLMAFRFRSLFCSPYESLNLVVSWSVLDPSLLPNVLTRQDCWWFSVDEGVWLLCRGSLTRLWIFERASCVWPQVLLRGRYYDQASDLRARFVMRFKFQVVLNWTFIL